MSNKAWQGFHPGKWSNGEIDTRDFIQRNYTPYTGDASFLAGPTAATVTLWNEILELSEKEQAAGGVLDADNTIVSTVNSHAAGYLDRTLEKIVGLQTDKPFKRPMHLSGGLRMAEQSLKMYGYEIDPQIESFYRNYRKTHNDGVFDAYTP